MSELNRGSKEEFENKLALKLSGPMTSAKTYWTIRETLTIGKINSHTSVSK